MRLISKAVVGAGSLSAVTASTSGVVQSAREGGRPDRKLALFVGACLAAYSVPAMAQEAAAAAPAAPAGAPGDQQAASSESGTDIIVTARRREERLQDVPIAVSVLSAETIESRGTFNPVDLPRSAPGLNVTAGIGDRNNVTYTIRGQGFSDGTVFPAVITYFNEVPIARLTQGQFFDLANVQVLRGPQGTNFGRVTSGGNVMITPQLPQEDFGGYVGGKLGDYGLRTVSGAINVPIVEDKVLARVAFETARRSGFTKNLFNGRDLDNVAYEAFRAGLTIRPVDDIENTTVVSYQHTHDNGTAVIYSGFNPAASGLLPAIGQFAFLFNGGYGLDANGSVVPLQVLNQPGFTPLSVQAYQASLQGQLDAQRARGVRKVSLVDPIYSRRKNLYIVNTTSVDLSDTIELKNIVGYVREREDQASVYFPANGGAVLTCHSACPGNPGIPFRNQEQISEELRLQGTLFDDRLNFALGGYMDEQRPAGLKENATIALGLLNRVEFASIRTREKAAYGNLEFAVTDRLKLNGGIRYTGDTVRGETNTYLSPVDGPAPRQALFNFLTGPFGGSLPADVADQVVSATFAPIPHGQCATYGAGSLLYGPGGAPCSVNKGKFNVMTWQTGASYQPGHNQLLYAKVSKGYRPGGVNTSGSGGAAPELQTYVPETDISVELGAKADWNLDGVFLRTNIAAYRDRYKSIQKLVTLPGAIPIGLITNVAAAKIKGIEAEALLIPVEGLNIGGNFAYTDAKFDRTPLIDNAVPSPCDFFAPSSTGAFCSRNRFTAVPKWQYAVTLDYTLPLPESIGKVSVGGSLFHQSSVALLDNSAIQAGSIEPGRTTVDLNVNWKDVGGQPVDLGFFVTNLTNKTYRIGSNNLLYNASVGVSGNIYAPPRMWGFSAKYRFGADAR